MITKHIFSASSSLSPFFYQNYIDADLLLHYCFLSSIPLFRISPRFYLRYKSILGWQANQYIKFEYQLIQPLPAYTKELVSPVEVLYILLIRSSSSIYIIKQYLLKLQTSSKCLPQEPSNQSFPSALHQLLLSHHDRFFHSNHPSHHWPLLDHH